MNTQVFDAALQVARIRTAHEQAQDDRLAAPTIPEPARVHASRAAVDAVAASWRDDKCDGKDRTEEAVRHIIDDVVPGLNGQAHSSRYYGFVIGGTLPIAEWADNVVSRVDQNLFVHLPEQSVSTHVEARALAILAQLLKLDENEWRGRTFTTGATSSNILGLSCAREALVPGTGEHGFVRACQQNGVSDVQILTSMGHSSLAKAAGAVGLGRASVQELRIPEEPWKLDLDAVEEHLKRPGIKHIIAISAGEINTGLFATGGLGEMKRLRQLADHYGAWIHVDGAFGIFVRALDPDDDIVNPEIHAGVAGLELADSITVDGHKILNVPYDCGIFFTRSFDNLRANFVNPNAAYLGTEAGDGIPSPGNICLENSRRFRALPVYAVLLSEGPRGLAARLRNMILLTQMVAAWVDASPDYELLPARMQKPAGERPNVYMTVLFRARDKTVNEDLVRRVNETRQLYIGGTMWKGEKAARMAVSTWKVVPERDCAVVTRILSCVAEGIPFDSSTI